MIAVNNHSPPYKAKVALAAIKGEKSLADLAQPFDVLIGAGIKISMDGKGAWPTTS